MPSIVTERVGRTNIRYIGIPLPKLRGVLHDLQQEALIRTAFWWREKYGPGHFEISAYSKYGGLEERVYNRRLKSTEHQAGRPSTDYRGRDLLRPLVWTGNLRTAFLSGHMKVKATGGNNSLKVAASWPNLPRHAYYTKFGKSRAPGPKMYLELTIMTADQERELAEHFSEELQKLINQESEGENAA